MTGKDVSMSYSDGSNYRIRVTDDDNNAIGNAVVTITVDGKSSKVTTDKNGWASFKLDLKAKTYVITAKYKNVKISNKVTVKSILKLNTNSIKKSSKDVIVKVSLAKINGKYLKSKQISLKLNGKKYSAKTDKNGLAKIKIDKNAIKNLKINKKYSVEISYLKDVIKKEITIKK